VRVDHSGEPSADRGGDSFKPVETSREFSAESFIARRDGERESRVSREREDGHDHDDEGRGRPAREGLPKRFRMRHGRHYVDELLGDAPIRTVREIAISEIEPPPDEALDPQHLDRLESSIRQLGVIEPLLVARRGLEYRVITGMRRLRAARTVGLNTVPCLVHDVDDERLGSMRVAATHRPAASVNADPNAATRAIGAAGDAALESPTEDEAVAPLWAAAFDAADVGDELSYLSAALPVRGPGVDERLRLALLTELAGVELFRAKIVSALADALTRNTPVERSAVSCDALVDEALSAIASEARLRGVTIEKVGPPPDVTISLDAASCRLALTGLLQVLLTLTTKPQATLQVRTQVTTVRPALIIDCALRFGDSEVVVIPEEARARFFDPEWREHPCGDGGAQVLGALARIARAHGGRVQASANGVTFVVPRPLSDI
jgi:hypothetical protein